MEGEPGPVGVVAPYPMLIETALFDSGPYGACAVPFDALAFDLRVGDSGRWSAPRRHLCRCGCMDYGDSLTKVAELLQAPVATSVSGKGVMDECHPLAVGWGYGHTRRAHGGIGLSKSRCGAGDRREVQRSIDGVLLDTTTSAPYTR
jgi:hypothetical protein